MKTLPDHALALANAATDGPWEKDDDTPFVFTTMEHEGPIPFPNVATATMQWKNHTVHLDNAAFIAASRTLVPLLAGRLKEACHFIRNCGADQIADELQRMPEGDA